MNKQWLKALTTALLFALFSGMVFGETAQNQSVPDISFNVETIKERLNLREEQEPTILEILESHSEKRSALLKKYELEPVPEGDKDFSLFTLRSFRGEIRELSKRTRQKMSGILTKEQLSEWLLIQKENAAALRAYLLSD